MGEHSTVLYCGKLDSGVDPGRFSGFADNPDKVFDSGYSQIFRVRVIEDASDKGITKYIRGASHTKDGVAPYYAWWAYDAHDFTFVTPDMSQLEEFFPRGAQYEIFKGTGTVYEVRVEVLDSLWLRQKDLKRGSKEA